jgi:hypothetical protein
MEVTMDQLISPTKEQPQKVQLLDETIQTLQMAIRTLSDPDAHVWPTLLHLLAFTRRLESVQAMDELTPAQQSIQLLRVMEENDGLRRELQQLVGKLAARSVARGVKSGALALQPAYQEPAPGGIGPFDPEVEPWLAALIAKSIPE